METHFTHGFISEEDGLNMNSNLSSLGFRLERLKMLNIGKSEFKSL